jgi:Transposase DDE domain
MLWIDEQAIEMWVNHKLSGKSGASKTYSDTAIECMLILKAVYNLALRSTEGLMQSVVKLLRVELPVPDYTTLCRRSKVISETMDTYLDTRYNKESNRANVTTINH